MRKLSADTPDEEIELVDEACKLEDRTRASFIRWACVIKAKEILEEQKCKK